MGARLKFWRRSRVLKKGIRDEAVPPSNLTRLYYNGSAAKSHSTTTQPPRPYSLFLEHGSAAKTLISHPHNTASYAGYDNTYSSQIPGNNKVHSFDRNKLLPFGTLATKETSSQSANNGNPLTLDPYLIGSISAACSSPVLFLQTWAHFLV